MKTARAGHDRAAPGRARAAWPPLRDAAVAAVLTVIVVAAAYGEAHPSTDAYFSPPHHPPHTPDAELLLVVLAGAVLAWRRRYPRLTMCVTTAATVGYTIPGNENGVVLLLPAVAIFSYAVMAPLRSAALWTTGITAVLMTATAAANPLGTFNGATALVPADNVVARLTEREREVLALVAQGLSNDEIAARLYLSPLTTKTHVSRIMTKLGARDRAQLVVLAYESGLVVPGVTS
jgi:DNA-binding CsgD family transcriptional regulator